MLLIVCHNHMGDRCSRCVYYCVVGRAIGLVFVMCVACAAVCFVFCGSWPCALFVIWLSDVIGVVCWCLCVCECLLLLLLLSLMFLLLLLLLVVVCYMTHVVDVEFHT